MADGGGAPKKRRTEAGRMRGSEEREDSMGLDGGGRNRPQIK